MLGKITRTHKKSKPNVSHTAAHICYSFFMQLFSNALTCEHRASGKALRLETMNWPGAKPTCSKKICYTHYPLCGLRQSYRNCAWHTTHNKSLLHVVCIY